MMNKLKILFLVTLCAVIVGCADDVSAQRGSGSGTVPVAGKNGISQSEINKLIKFYEWAFEASFSPDERARYQTSVVDGFRQNAAEGRKNADSLLSAYDKVRAKDAETQAKLREMFNESFVKDLRAANDDASQMLLGIYERGQNGGSDGSVREVLPSEEDLRDAGTPSTNRGSAGSSKLVGEWTRSVGAGRGDDGTGKTTYESGSKYTFEFRADGTMRFLSETKVLSIMQCRVTEITKLPGTYSVSSGEVTMNLGTGTSVGTSSCEAKGNFKNTLSASTLKKKFIVKNLDSVFRPDAPLILCFDGADGDACYEKSIPYNK
jgi:hypothetical protein